MAERMRQGSPLQNFRLERSLWNRFGRAAAKNGTNRTAVIRQMVLWYIHEAGAVPVQRPETPTPPTLPEKILDLEDDK